MHLSYFFIKSYKKPQTFNNDYLFINKIHLLEVTKLLGDYFFSKKAVDYLYKDEELFTLLRI